MVSIRDLLEEEITAKIQQYGTLLYQEVESHGNETERGAYLYAKFSAYIQERIRRKGYFNKPEESDND